MHNLYELNDEQKQFTEDQKTHCIVTIGEIISKHDFLKDEFMKKIKLPIYNEKMTATEKNIAEVAFNIMASYKELRNRSSVARKNWSEGFYNGYLYAMKGIKKRAESQADIWNDDFQQTQDNHSKGIVTGLKFMLEEIENHS